MELLTKVDIQSTDRQIGYQDRILMLGSCFADNIGAKFEEYYFQATINPFGTLYNPASIAEAIRLSGSGDGMFDVVQHNGLWHSMMHHGSFSHTDKAKLIQRVEESKKRLQRALQEAKTIVVTFGTAWVYEYQGKVVANCHKLSAREFVRRRLTVEEVVRIWRPIVEQMADKQWIFTVSPIRHIKDGLHENQVSKAILLQAIEAMSRKAGDDEARVSYFPSYEIMLDELRDYRYYAEDMVHPSAVAVEYIWQRFVDSYINKDTQMEMRVLHQLWRDSHHRFLHPQSEEAQGFKHRLEQRKQELRERYPWIE